MGAGVGGLTTAHKLSRMGHKVHVLERNSEVGGVARSKYLNNGQHSEYCWHVFMKGYTNLLPILQEIPFRGASVAEQLKPISQYCYGRNGDHFMIEHNCFMGSQNIPSIAMQGRKLGYNFTAGDIWRLALFYVFAHGSHPERFEKYDNSLWCEFMGSLSNDTKKLVIDSIGCYLGLEPNRVNTHTIIHFLKKAKVVPSFADKHREKDGSVPLCYSLNGPTNEHWLEPWTRYLSCQGVEISLNTTIKEIRCERGKVEEIVVSDNGVDRSMEYDYYVNSMDVQSFSNILCNNSSLKHSMVELNRRSYQIQTQVLFHLQEKVYFNKPSVVIHFDSPWVLMFRPEGPLWDVPLGKGDIKSGELLSVGIGAWHRKGLLYNKTAHECTEQEIVHEVWRQIKSSRGLLKHFKTNTGKTLDDVTYTSYNIWPSFRFSDRRGGLDTWEPKFSNNVGTFALRPDTIEPSLSNLVHANAYTRTDNNLYNMDAAAEAGIRAGNYILKREALADHKKYETPTKFWLFCQEIDHVLLSRNISNPVEVLLNKQQNHFPIHPGTPWNKKHAV